MYHLCSMSFVQSVICAVLHYLYLFVNCTNDKLQQFLFKIKFEININDWKWLILTSEKLSSLPMTSSWLMLWTRARKVKQLRDHIIMSSFLRDIRSISNRQLKTNLCCRTLLVYDGLIHQPVHDPKRSCKILR